MIRKPQITRYPFHGAPPEGIKAFIALDRITNSNIDVLQGHNTFHYIARVKKVFDFLSTRNHYQQMYNDRSDLVCIAFVTDTNDKDVSTVLTLLPCSPAPPRSK